MINVFRHIVPIGSCVEETLNCVGDHAHVLDRFFMSLSQSRKSRAGKAFETIIQTLFTKLSYPYTPQAVINGKPDFIIPNVEHFHRNAMDCIIFTAKRTLRERWRQIVTEGTRGFLFFLATIDGGLTDNQLQEMQSNRIYVVVPQEMKTEFYTKANNVISFEMFFSQHLDPAMIRWKKNSII